MWDWFLDTVAGLLIGGLIVLAIYLGGYREEGEGDGYER